MTNAEIIALAVADPLVIDRHSPRGPNGTPIPPAPLALEAIATSELQNELYSLLSEPVIARALLEADTSLTLATGTTVAQGMKFTLPKYVGSVISITTGTGHRPLRKWKTREDFETWYYQSSPDTTNTQDAMGWTVWERGLLGEIVILISPGIGDDTTANVHYQKAVGSPVSVSIFPDNMQFLVSMGLRNRLSGGQLQDSYERDRRRVLSRIEPMTGGVSPIPLSRDDEEFNRWQSVLVAGPESSDSPLFISQRQ